MRKKNDIISKINYLNTNRAGSMFPEEFERGMIYGLLYSLDQEPHFNDIKEVNDFIENFVWRKKVLV